MHVAALRPDVLVAQEVEPLDSVLLFAGEQPTFRDRIGDPAFPKRAVGVFSYTGTKLVPVDVASPSYAFRRYEAEWKGVAFQVVGVWTSATKVRETSYRQAHEGLVQHADWIRQRPTVVLGDFNDNSSFKSGSWLAFLDLATPLGLVSAYHHHSGEEFGAESKATHFHHGKQTKPFHLDYCFVPTDWAKLIRSVEVGRYEDWRDFSDHVPLTVDLNL